MSQGALAAFIADYIATRRQSKLEQFDKDAAKRLAAGERDESTLLQERRELETRFETRAWLTDAASRASQISLVTHAAKFTHGDSRSSSVYRTTTTDDGYLSTASLENPAADAVGNAAALDVAKLLQTEAAGDSLLAALQRGDASALQALAQDDAQLQHWVDGFSRALTTSAPASHKLAKQIYFPVGDGYHLLSPLFASSLAHAMHQKMLAYRFGDEAKAGWAARKKQHWHSTPLTLFLNTAEMHFGGTKPQNISSLNSSRGGRVWLLCARPPVWQRQEKPPRHLKSIFAGEAFNGAASGTVKRLADLLAGVKDYTNLAIRQARDRYVDELIDTLFAHASELQREEWQGWSLQCEALITHQQYWLDPWRARQDEAFRRERDNGSWQSAVAEDFGRWLNYRLGKRLPDVGKVEKAFWGSRPLFRQRLREMESIIGEALS
ncbi:type I-F CRISPR-associated protein Csy1 [Cronobacter turicensis]|uniref:type I-F CRISPR-associated protein Csy1 n=1 Tax=Cronobacter turicensis TaxID=413502 RepID=UPI001D81E46F|nr:type I-F CRISPR-associated protein Csy1 [Cronobacter turicensis]EGT5680796.1 type I-F CRISPR-associated protein Csy1 [Cronobacter turicensis]EGT5739826.1 type I-F CRISPR-associated protein Csy1 [Cronobacter turicensis]ELY6320810.1 type I-F CRISPR-associated protein Csy1 [Cronobacter turicensis]MDI6430662.1 type I-F CRISPR-associated protein Csy1 [Cronobacter turicensis]